MNDDLRSRLRSFKKQLASAGVVSTSFDPTKPPPVASVPGTMLAPKDPELWKPYFLWALRNLGTVAQSCDYAAITRRDLEEELHASPEFAKDVDYALRDYLDRLERRAFQLAEEGDPNLLKFILTSRKSDYRPAREVTHSFRGKQRAELIDIAIQQGLSREEAEQIAASVEAEFTSE